MAVVANAEIRIQASGAQAANRELRNVSGNLNNINTNSRGADRAVGGFSSRLSSLFRVAAASGALAAVGRGILRVVQLASEAEETTARFATVFARELPEANAIINNLSDTFGIARQEAEAYIGQIGDVAQGLGLTSDASLTLADNITRLAADQASFNNTAGGTERAVNALYSAILTGEAEAAKSLGLALQENQQRAYAESIGLTFNELTNLERIQLRYDLAVSQSQNAIGDAVRTQDSFANQSRRLASALSDAGVSIGEVFLPAATRTVSIIRSLVSSFQNLEPVGQAAVIAIGAVGTALVALSLNPVVGAIAGIAAVTTGIVALSSALGETERELGVNNAFGLLGEGAELSAKAIDEASVAYRDFGRTVSEINAEFNLGVSTIEQTVDRTREAIDNATTSLGLSTEAQAALLASTIQGEALNSEITNLLQNQLELTVERINATRADASAGRELNEVNEAALAIEVERIAANKRVTDAFNDASQAERDLVESQRVRINLLDEEISESQILTEQIDLLSSQILELAMSEDITVDNSNLVALSDRLANLRDEHRRVTEEAERARAELNRQPGALFNYREAAVQASRALQELSARTAAAREDFADLISGIQQATAQVVSFAQISLDTAAGLFDAIAGYQNRELEIYERAQQERINLERDERDELLANENLTSAERMRIQENYAREVEAIDRQTAIKRYQLEVEQFETEKAFSIVRIAIETAQGVAKAIAVLPPLGFILAGIVAAAGIAQTAIVAATPPPPPPALQEGGIVQPVAGGRRVIVGEGGDQEAVIPLNAAVLGQLADAIVARQGERQIIIQNIVDTDLIAEAVIERQGRNIVVDNGNVST